MRHLLAALLGSSLANRWWVCRGRCSESPHHARRRDDVIDPSSQTLGPVGTGLLEKGIAGVA